MMNNDLTYINQMLRKFGIYVYDKIEANKLAIMRLEIQELYRNELITKEEYIRAISIIRNRGV